jgi:hypothetical protein
MVSRAGEGPCNMFAVMGGIEDRNVLQKQRLHPYYPPLSGSVHLHTFSHGLHLTMVKFPPVNTFTNQMILHPLQRVCKFTILEKSVKLGSSPL